MDLSGTSFNLALPYSAAAAFGEDAGSGDVDMLAPAISNALQYHMNTASTITPDPRDAMRPFSHRLRNTLQVAGEDLMSFLRPEESAVAEMPCFVNHTTFLSGLNTAGFVSSPSWMSRNLREVIHHEAVLADISGALGMSLSSLRSTIQTAMDLYIPTIEAMDASYKQIDKKLKEIDNVTRQLLSLPSVKSTELETAILHYTASQYESCRLQENYETFCTNYAKFQAYRSVLGLVGGQGGSPICVICMTEPVSCAVVPCGHTFCTKCGQSQRSQCYLCRTPVREKQRLYFT
jgi:hypothetical protein